MIVVGSTLGSLLGFYIGKRKGYLLARELYGKEKVDKMKSILDSYGKWFVALSAISPLPYIPLIFGSLNMEGRKFIYYGLIPRILGIIAVWLLLLANINILV